jgi:acyl-CoA thioesterase-1
MLWILGLPLAALGLAAVQGGPVRPRIVAFGDSLTAGYGIGEALAFPAVLQSQLDAEGFDYAVINAGVSGATSSAALGRLDTVLAGEVRILIVALGVNDGLRRVPVETLRGNLARIIEAAQARQIAVVLCGMEAPPIHGWAYTAAFHHLYQELAAQYHVPLVPFVMLSLLGRPDRLLQDRLHPNAAGARAIADQVWPHLRPLLRRVA